MDWAGRWPSARWDEGHVRAAVDRLVGRRLEGVRYVYLSGVVLGPFDPGPRLPMIDPVDRLVAVGFGGWWLLVGWAFDGMTSGLLARVEGCPELDFDDPVDPPPSLEEGEWFFDGRVDGLSGEAWAGLPGRVLTGYDLAWFDDAGDGVPQETLFAVRLEFGDDVVTVMLGEVREAGEVGESADELIVVRGAALGDGLVRRFLEACEAAPVTVAPGRWAEGPQPWEELAAAGAFWDEARRRVLAGGAEGLLRGGLADLRGRGTALGVVSAAPLDLVGRLLPELVECALAARAPGRWADWGLARDAAEVMGRLPAGFVRGCLAPCVEELVGCPSASAGRVSAVGWLLEALGLADLSRTLAERPDGEPGDGRPPQPGGAAVSTGGGAGAGPCGVDRPAVGGARPGTGGLAGQAWADALAASDLWEDVFRRMAHAGRYTQFGLALRDAAAAPAMLRVLSVNPPYWTQAVFGDVLGWALGSSDLVGPARRAVGRLPRDWVRFELSGRVADLAKDPRPDPDPGWEARTRMGQLLGFLGEADLLAVLRQGAGGAGSSFGGASRAGGGGG